eukprot:XP_014778703.1 PREDICTED: MAM and LDL-receptor class A domain-containing protein 1-like [Octopus bimaculoides]
MFETIFVIPVTDTGNPTININISIIIEILNSTSSKSILSITSILEVELLTPKVTPATTVTIPTTSPISTISTTHDIPVSSQAVSAQTSTEDTASLSTIYQPDNTTKVTPVTDDRISKASPLTTETPFVDFTGTRVSGASTKQPSVDFTGTKMSGTSTKQPPSHNFTGTRVSGASTKQPTSVDFTGTRVSGASTKQPPSRNFTGTRVSGASTKQPSVDFTGTKMSGTSTKQPPSHNFTGTRVSGASTKQPPSRNFTGTRVSGASTKQPPSRNFTGTRVSGASTKQPPSRNFTGTKMPGTFTTQLPNVNFTGTTAYRNTTQATSYTRHSSFTSYMPPTGSTTTPTISPVKCELGLSPCSSNDQCIQENWFCDKVADCRDGSDENQVKCGWNETKPTVGPKFPNGIELNCNFENPDRRLCKYQTSNGSYTWSVQRGPTLTNSTGPQFDHSYQDETGNYVFTESTYGSLMDNASLVSDFIMTDNETSSLSFYYHMYGENMGSLSVYFDIRENGQMKTELKWTKSGDNGNYWMKACISLPANTVLRTHFIANRGRLHTSDIALDDIKYSMEPCQKLPCMFDDSMCGEVVSPSGENPASYKWHAQRSVTMWNMAEQMGLLGDHTMGSKFARYMVANSSEGSSGDKTMYRTPVLSNENNTSLNFRYFINGKNVDKLTVNIRYSNSLESKTWSKNKDDSQSWHRGCLPVAGNIGAVAEFIAYHGSGPDGVIAVDDIVLLKSQSCDTITECEFGKDIYCGFKVSGDRYRWQMHHSIKGEFIEAIGENREGLKTMLTSQTFTPVSSDSVTLKYFMRGSVSLYINAMEKDANGKETTTTLWTGSSQVTPDMLNPPPPLDLENLLLREVKETSSQNDQIDWMKVCVPLPSKPLAIQIVSLKRDVVTDAMALKYVGVSDEKCKVGLMMTSCSFKEPNMCNYTIDCSTNTQFMWHRTTGFKAKGLTGPQRDHTSNRTDGHFLQADSSKGRPGDKTNVMFANIKVSKQSSFRFYYYMYGSDIDSLQVNVNEKMAWKETGAKTQFWYLGCVDLPLNTQVNVSFTATRGMGPLGDIAIDDVSVSHHPCPARDIDCSFEDEMMCGYTNIPASQADNKAMVEDQWFRSNISLKELSIIETTFVNDYHLLTTRPSRIRSPQIQFPSASCLQFSYFILMGKGTNITVTAIYNDSSKTEENVFGINNFTWADWRSGQMNLQSGKVAIEFSVRPYDQKFLHTFFAINDVKVVPNTCQPLVCSNANLKKCSNDDVCIPKYQFCDNFNDCADGSDEAGCTSVSKDIRLVDGITIGHKGRLEVLVNGSWGSAYGLQWSEVNARVACKQLGFTGYAQSIGFGKYHYGVGTMWKVNCFGNESRIQDCNLNRIENNVPHLSDVGLVCYNTTCETSKTPCPQYGNMTYPYCLFEDQFCDGDYDCPDGYDEKNCCKLTISFNL